MINKSTFKKRLEKLENSSQVNIKDIQEKIELDKLAKELESMSKEDFDKMFDLEMAKLEHEYTDEYMCKRLNCTPENLETELRKWL